MTVLSKILRMLVTSSKTRCQTRCTKFNVVTRMDTPNPGWKHYVVYTTEIVSFLHNRSIISNGKRSFKNQISVAGHLLHRTADKYDNF